MTAIRILVADDHPMVRRALAEALQDVIEEAPRVDEAGTVAAARVALQASAFDLVLLDLNMPGMNGMLGLSALRVEFPAVPILVVSAIEDSETMQQVIEVGASGFLPKSAPMDAIGEAVKAVLAGDIWLPIAEEEVGAEAEAESVSRIGVLTQQQRRVLVLLGEGKLNKQIAFEMDVTEATIKAHLTQIFRKLGVHSRTQAVIVARRLNSSAMPRKPTR